MAPCAILYNIALLSKIWLIFEMWDSFFFIVIASQMQVWYLWLGDEFQTANMDHDRNAKFLIVLILSLISLILTATKETSLPLTALEGTMSQISPLMYKCGTTGQCPLIQTSLWESIFILSKNKRSQGMLFKKKQQSYWFNINAYKNTSTAFWTT